MPILNVPNISSWTSISILQIFHATYWLSTSMFIKSVFNIKQRKICPVQQAGTSTARTGCSESHPDWWWISPGMGRSSPLGELVQCLTTLIVNNFFLVSKLSFPSFSLKSFPLLLSARLCYRLSPSFLLPPFRYWMAALRLPGTFSSPGWTASAFSSFHMMLLS